VLDLVKRSDIGRLSRLQLLPECELCVPIYLNAQ
jgi:hypothetical protein